MESENRSESHSEKDASNSEDSQEYKGARPIYAPVYDPDPSLTRCRRQRKWLGLDPDKPLKPHEAGAEKFLWSRIRTNLQEPFSEFLGTMVLTCFYMGSIAQCTLGAGLETAPAGMGYGTFNSVPWG